MAGFGRFWRTVRHLRPVQIYGRLWFRLVIPRPNLSLAPPLRRQEGSWQTPASRPGSLLAPDLFRFLNENGSLTNLGWDNPDRSKLWRYNQHYFDDLNAHRAGSRSEWHLALIAKWINSNPPVRGSGWEPYPTSLRIVNWIKWVLAGNSLPDPAITSLAVQARWLTQRLERHLLGNHLFANAKALVFAGLFFDGPEADKWLSLGLKILRRQIPEQILSDGGQFELSTMYHALAVEDMLDLINISEAYGKRTLANSWREQIPPMLEWLQTMSHPDGRIAFFNDAAFGIASDNAELFAYAFRLGLPAQLSHSPLRQLHNSGYLCMSSGAFHLIADFAQVGPDHLPGHAHADTLSIELSVAGQRVFVNSGTSEYGVGPERQRQRSTAAHNTVLVSGQNSSEVWSGFRVGRRARPLDLAISTWDGKLRAQGSHDGYKHLAGRPIVRRTIELDGAHLVVSDSVSVSIQAEARYHLHPSIQIHMFANSQALLVLPGGQRLRVDSQVGALRFEAATWHPEFGVSIPNKCLVVPLVDSRATLSVKSV